MAEVVAGDTHAGGVPVASAAAVDGVVPPVEQVAGDRDVGDRAEVGGEVHTAGLVVRVEDRVVPDDVVGPAVLLDAVIVGAAREGQVVDVGVGDGVVAVHLDAVFAPVDVHPCHRGAIPGRLDGPQTARRACHLHILDGQVLAANEMDRVVVRGRNPCPLDRHVAGIDGDRAVHVLGIDHGAVGGHGYGPGAGELGAGRHAGVGGVREATRMRAGYAVGVPGDRAAAHAGRRWHDLGSGLRAGRLPGAAV